MSDLAEAICLQGLEMPGPGDDDKPCQGGASGPGGASPVSPARPGEIDGGGKQEGTTFARLPQFAGAALMPKIAGKLLENLRTQIAQLTLEIPGSGIRHDEGRYVVLPRTLRSAWMVRVRHPLAGEIRFLVGQTRSTWVLLYDTPHETIYEDPRFLGMELKRRDVTRTPKGKRMYVSLIERADLDQLNAIAAQDARVPVTSNSLAPTEGSFSLERTIARLRSCALEHCTDPSFLPATFFGQVHFVTPTQGEAGDYYYIEAGDPDDPVTCELHVGRDPQLPQGTFTHRATLSWHGERAYLFIDVSL